MTIESPQESYRHAAQHWAECPVCTGAGGEQADPCELCATGRSLLFTCEQADKRWLSERAEAYGG